VTRRTAFIVSPFAFLFAVCAFADGAFSGRDRFDLDRPEIRQFVDATAAEQKIAPLEIYRLLAKA